MNKLSTLELIRLVQDNPSDWPETMDMTELELHRYIMSNRTIHLHTGRKSHKLHIDWSTVIMIGLIVIAVFMAFGATGDASLALAAGV